MSKPDDIPQDVWAAAINARKKFHDDDRRPLPPFALLDRIIARAILAERERCAKVAEENRQPGFTDFVDGYNTSCLDIAADIRGGSA